MKLSRYTRQIHENGLLSFSSFYKKESKIKIFNACVISTFVWM